MNLLAISLDSLSKFTQPPYPAILLAAFLVIFFIYVFIAKSIANKNEKKEPETKKAPEATTQESAADKPNTIVAVAGTSAGSLELVNTDEKTAAVIMAIVSNQSGIPLERLQFKSITLMED